MRNALVALILVVASSPAIAEEPPIRGGLVEGVKCGSDPTQTYTLYLPSVYDSERLWPVLLVLDPRGRSVTAAELFREAAEEYGWIILSSNNTRSDTAADQHPRHQCHVARAPDALCGRPEEDLRRRVLGHHGQRIYAGPWVR